LLDITNDYFSKFFGEEGTIDTIKLKNSAIATGDFIFRFVGCIKKESLPKNDELRNLMRFAYRGIWTGDSKNSTAGLILSLDDYRNLCLKKVLV